MAFWIYSSPHMDVGRGYNRPNPINSTRWEEFPCRKKKEWSGWMSDPSLVERNPFYVSFGPHQPRGIDPTLSSKLILFCSVHLESISSGTFGKQTNPQSMYNYVFEDTQHLNISNTELSPRNKIQNSLMNILCYQTRNFGILIIWPAYLGIIYIYISKTPFHFHILCHNI